MSSVHPDPFYADSPRRILKKAQHLAGNVEHSTQLQQTSKIAQLKELAERRKDDVKMAIDYGRSQNDLFRKLQQEDIQRRRSLLISIEGKIDKISSKKSDYVHKRSLDAHKNNEGVTKHLSKHLRDEEKFAQKCQQQSRQMTKNMIDFHKKQMQELQQEWQRLRSLKTCHRKAEMLIQNRQHKKEEFAFKTLKELQLDFEKNGKKENPELLENSRRKSKRWSNAWETARDFYDSKHTSFLQTYCTDLDSANSMQGFKKDEFKKTSQRINKFLVKRTEKWAKLKSRVDRDQAVVPEKCLSKINKSLNSSMRQTSSTFFDTCSSWRKKNDIRKERLREIQTERDNRILFKHLDSTRRNRDEDGLNNTMTDMMMRASFHAREFL